MSHAFRIGNKKGTLIDYIITDGSLTINKAYKKGTLIDYIITDGSLTINKAYVFDTLIKTDHMATLSILNLTLTKKSTVSTKLVFDKTNLDIKTFQKTIKNSDWNFFTQIKT